MKSYFAQRRRDADNVDGGHRDDEIDDDDDDDEEEEFDIDGYSAGRGGRALHTRSIICVEPATLPPAVVDEPAGLGPCCPSSGAF